jgi:hypothetical protein
MRRSSFIPDETYPPLIVDSYCVLSLPIGLERFKPVAGRDTKVANHAGLVQKTKLPQRDILNIRRQFSAPAPGPNQVRLRIGRSLGSWLSIT